MVVKIVRYTSYIISVFSIWELILGIDGGILKISGIKIRTLFFILNILFLTLSLAIKPRKKPDLFITISIVVMFFYGFLWSYIGLIFYGNKLAFNDGQSIISVIYIFAIYQSIIQYKQNHSTINFYYKVPLTILFSGVSFLWIINTFTSIDISFIIDNINSGDSLSLIGADSRENSRFYFLSAVLLPLVIFIFGIESTAFKPAKFYSTFLFYFLSILAVGSRGVALSAVPLLLTAIIRFQFNKTMKFKNLLFFLIFIIFAISCSEWIFDSFINKSRYVSFENFGESDSLRIEQFSYLIDAFLKHPIFGNGFGFYTGSYLRSFDRPYNYELFYVSLLMKTGIVGFLVYLLFLFLILMPIFSKRYNFNSFVKINYVLIWATTIIAGATNPFLQNPIGFLLLYSPWLYLDFIYRSDANELVNSLEIARKTTIQI